MLITKEHPGYYPKVVYLTPESTRTVFNDDEEHAAFDEGFLDYAEMLAASVPVEEVVEEVVEEPIKQPSITKK